MAQIFVTNIKSFSVDWYITGLGRDWNSSNYWVAGIGSSPAIEGGTIDPTAWSWASAPSSGSSRSTQTVNLSSLAPFSSYRGYGFVQVLDFTVIDEVVYPIWRWYNAGFVDFITRPLDFFWTYPKIQGQDFNLYASEWNNLTLRINQFRGFRRLGGVSFTSATVGADFTASMYNQAANAISGMSPPTGLPRRDITNEIIRYSNDSIKASDLNGLISSLNSIY